MSVHHTPTPDSHRPPLKKPFLSKCILACCILLAGVTVFVEPIWQDSKEKSGPQKAEQLESTALSSRSTTLTSKSQTRPPQHVQPGEETKGQSTQPLIQSNSMEQAMEPLETPLPAQTSPMKTAGDMQQVPLTCSALARELHAFFVELDSKPYVQSFGLSASTSTQQHFTALLKKLLDTPPVVTRETDDLYTILTNMAHFFRIIGRDNIALSKAVLGHEREKIEDVFKNLYNWVLYETCDQEMFRLNVPLEQLYEYAGFFLNTMGGRSYLFRRDSRSRILINYYAVLIVDQMEKRGRNRHGIDPVLSLPLLINEIESSNQLIYKEQYLERLYMLMEANE